MNYPSAFIQFCDALIIRLTSIRKAILFILWSAQGPLKAYEILEELIKINPNARPPTVYRSLLFFLEGGMVHKIESIQSFTLCIEPQKHLSLEILMVCHLCHRVCDIHDDTIGILMNQLAARYDFVLNQGTIELKGSCKDCSL